MSFISDDTGTATLEFINGITNRETHYSIEKITALTE